MAHEEFEQNLALYAVGALEPLERQALEAHLTEGCQMCWSALKDYRETTGLLPHGLPITALPPHLKGRIETAALAQVLAQTTGADADATIRTPDSDVTIRTPGPPVVVPAGDVTVRLPNQPAGDVTVRLPNQPEVIPAGDVTVRLPNLPDADATVRMPSQPATRTAPPVKAVQTQSPWWAWATTPAFAAASVALVLGIGAYSFFLNSKVALETAQRQHAETALQQQTIQTAALRQELTQSQQELNESKQRLSVLTPLQDIVAQREMDLERLRTQLAQKEQELVGLYKTASPKDEMLAMLQSANVRVLSLAGTDAAKSAGGLVLYDAERGKAFLYAFNMPALPRGKVYQLWTITTKPVSAGTFHADTGRKCRHLAHSLPAKSGITKFAVSIEPEGGKPQPTGAIYLHGSL